MRHLNIQSEQYIKQNLMRIWLKDSCLEISPKGGIFYFKNQTKFKTLAIKPSTENQAISRTYRMGQTRNVQVFRLLWTDSVDERMVEILEQKEEVFENFADSSVIVKESVEIDKQICKNIIASEKERIKNII